MSEIRTVTLELMRHGAGYPQILSPSTDYLALCGDHPPETVAVPADHPMAMTAGYRVLRHDDSEETRELQLRQAATLVSSLLGRVPGLLAELAAGQAAGQELLHLQLVLTGPELSLLPFELADSPRGAPGSGRPLFLQGDLPVCITRQVRRVGQRPFTWPEQPKILLATASPEAAGEVPLEDHRQALIEALEPWLPYAADAQERRSILRRHLVILPRADLAGLEETCRRQHFTHVHLLAHGASFRYGGFEHFGVALHGPDGQDMEVVDGDRLAMAIGAQEGRLGPQVVTLASCHSARSGSLIDGGSSVAHTLHRAGIPMVVASQFSLSADGSTLITRKLYDRLLWGSDIRRTLYRLRRELRLRLPKSHDWAGLVVYTSLPADPTPGMDAYRVLRADAAVHNALDWVDRLIQRSAATSLDSEPLEPASPVDFQSQVETALSYLARARERLKTRRQAPGAWGLLAGTEKRRAEIYHLAAIHLRHQGAQERADDYQNRSSLALAEAQKLYRRLFLEDLRCHWAITQYLCLGQMLGSSEPTEASTDESRDRWNLAALAGRLDLERPGRQVEVGREQAWAHSSLIELHALRSCLFDDGDHATDLEKALEHGRRLAALVETFPIDVYSCRQQLRRYFRWFCRVRNRPGLGRAANIARQAADLLPIVDPGAQDLSYVDRSSVT